MNTIYLEPAMVPATLRGTYNGKMFKAVVTESVNVPVDAGLWSGGSRDYYSGIDMETGQDWPFPNQDSAPWSRTRHECEVKLIPGYAVVKHSMFCGKDMGLTFYVHPDNAAKLLPVNVELTANEQLVINGTCKYKSSYNGQDRYEMMRRDVQGISAHVEFPSRHEWNEAKLSLIGKGLLNKAGAITPAGRNARK